MKKVKGVGCIIAGVILAVIGFGAIVPSVKIILSGDTWGFVRALPSLLFIIAAFATVYYGYRTLKRQ